MILILAALIVTAQTTVQRWWSTVDGLKLNEMILGGDTVRIQNGSNGQVLARVGGKWINWTPYFPQLLEFSDTMAIIGTKSDLLDYLRNDSVIIQIDFKDLSVFYYTVPFNMTLSTQESQFNDATIDPILGTALSKFDIVTVTPDTTGLIILSGSR